MGAEPAENIVCIIVTDRRTDTQTHVACQHASLSLSLSLSLSFFLPECFFNSGIPGDQRPTENKRLIHLQKSFEIAKSWANDTHTHDGLDAAVKQINSAVLIRCLIGSDPAGR